MENAQNCFDLVLTFLVSHLPLGFSLVFMSSFSVLVLSLGIFFPFLNPYWSLGTFELFKFLLDLGSCPHLIDLDLSIIMALVLIDTPVNLTLRGQSFI